MNNLTEKIKEIGFDKFAEVDLEQIVFDKAFRQLCEVNTCQKYGTNYMCPPHIGGAEECIDKVKQYPKGIIVQSIIQLEDSFDFEGMMAGQKEHDLRIRQLANQLQGKEYLRGLYGRVKERYIANRRFLGRITYCVGNPASLFLPQQAEINK